MANERTRRKSAELERTLDRISAGLTLSPGIGTEGFDPCAACAQYAKVEAEIKAAIALLNKLPDPSPKIAAVLEGMMNVITAGCSFCKS